MAEFQTKIVKVFARHGSMSVAVRVGGNPVWATPSVWIECESMGGYFTVVSACALLGRIAAAVEYAQSITPIVQQQGWKYYDETEEPSQLTEFPGTKHAFQGADARGVQ